ncbi:hypothetical protein [Angustibacter aerolatus]
MSEQPQGIEHAVDQGVADGAAVDPDADTDLQSADERVDPDDPEEAMRSAAERSTDPS